MGKKPLTARKVLTKKVSYLQKGTPDRNILKPLFYLLFAVLLIFSCKKSAEKSKERPFNIKNRYTLLLNHRLDSNALPRSYDPNTKSLRKIASKDWTSGFFPGTLFYLSELTGDQAYQKRALEWLPFIEKEKYNDGTHDMGFKIFCSYGNAHRLMPNDNYRDIILHSARTLSTRFNETVGCIRSWDFAHDKWQFPVIVDNMMNLELLFEATRLSGDSLYHNIAVTHANTTLKNHYRDNASSFHVVDYDTLTGQVRQKVTHQGFSPESSWARGQAWGIYGYTMAYRYTKDPAYLTIATAAADRFITHHNLPDDGIPYWDFDAPNIPNEPRDVSAAMILASALYELNSYQEDPKYMPYSEKVLANVQSEAYTLDMEVTAPFLLTHSTGSFPGKDEIEVSLNYADYYFLEALLRQQDLQKK